MPPRGGGRQSALAAAGVGPANNRANARSRSPPGRGGGRQSAIASQTSASSTTACLPGAGPPAEDNQFRRLVNKLFMENKFSGVMTQQICKSAAGAGASEVRDLGKAGAGGRQLGNAQRDLMRALLKDKTDACNLYWAKVPLLDPGSGELEHTDFPFLLPHELFAKMIAKKPINHFKGGASGELLAEMGTSCKTLGIDSDHAVPIGLHGDGVPHSKQGSTEVFSWNFAGLPHCDRFLAASIDKRACCKCGCAGRHTTDPIIAVLCLSFRCMIAGRFPT